ncbi:DUF1145 domain-containing protein [Pseudomonas sp. DTU_2021_1001937_2_SI_NGA_ILE_001]|uniref:DUF1145 domain-containing protein n=1 Tax=Pseudomonas sp. DTU_2021_1001937_2_SI_NGA_ILE_001 TaxID=3077589 RepID=UPI0028FC0B23|nr:DUF1145 domain-containing protein [Pseudomonas sp. DTU_2021_1001937_2_SI_NGA_ILE_001]WNW11519.1 DUF1145 domain-containing protein [Pseudomonas sp. DTU_2021_1001937_2_SI_NGA_ILE_001]
MKLFWGLGKLLMLVVWAVILLNLAVRLPGPFDVLFDLAGGLLLAVHVLDILVFNARLRGRPQPWRDRGKIILFGIFHIKAIGTPEVRHA